METEQLTVPGQQGRTKTKHKSNIVSKQRTKAVDSGCGCYLKPCKDDLNCSEDKLMFAPEEVKSGFTCV